MTGQLIAIVTVGVGLAGLLVALFAWLRSDMMKGEERLRQDMKQGEGRLEARINGVRGEVNGVRGEVAETRTEVSQLRERMAHLEGLLEGLRAAVTRPAAS